MGALSLSHWTTREVPKILVFNTMLLLLSHFSRVQLCATPETAAHEAPLSLGFSRQEHWSGLPFPSPMQESEVAQSCPTLGNPMDCSPPGSSVHGIFQARVLEWGAIAFSTLIPYIVSILLSEFSEIYLPKFQPNMSNRGQIFPSMAVMNSKMTATSV